MPHPVFAPTVLDWPNFNAEEDAKSLRAAMKGLGTDENALIALICTRSVPQRKEVALIFKTMYGRDLIHDIKSETSGKLEAILIHLFNNPIELDAFILNHSVKGLGTDEDAIVEIMCTRTGLELAAIKEEYKKTYKNTLEKDLVGDTSGDFKRILVSLTAGHRNNEDSVDLEQAKKDAEALYQAGEGRLGTNEEVFNMIMCLRSFSQLKATFEMYHVTSNNSIIEAISKEFSGHIQDALLAIAKTALYGRDYYFAERLNSSMAGLGTKDKKLIRLIISRSNVDLKAVKKHYLKLYQKNLDEAVASEISGDYKTAMLTLIHGNS